MSEQQPKQSFHIRKIALKRFKKFSDISLDFAPGLNVVIGPNEHGKSTIVDAIIAGIFFSPESRATYVTTRKSWYHNELYVIAMELEISGVRYDLRKDFADKYIHLRSLGTASKEAINLDTVEAVQKFLIEKLGIASAEVFEASGCVRQTAMAEIALHQKEIDKSLEQALTSSQIRTSASEQVQKAKQKVAELKKGLKTVVAQPGRLRDIKDKLLRDREEFARLSKSASEASRNRSELAKAYDKQEKGKVAVASKQAIYDKALAQAQAGQKLQQLEHEYARIQQIIDARAKLQQEIDFVQSKLSQANCTVDELRTASRDLLTLKIKIDEQSTRVPVEVSSVPNENTTRTKLWFGAAISSAIGIAGFFTNIALVFGFVVALGCILAAFFLKQRDDQSKQARDQNQARVQEEIEKFRRREQDILRKYNCESAREIDKQQQELESLTEKKRQLDAQLNLIDQQAKSAKTEGGIDMERANLLMNIEIAKKQLGNAKPLSPEKVLELEHELGELKAYAAQVQSYIERREGAAEAAQSHPEQLVRLEEEIAALEQEEKEEEARIEMYETLGAHLERARVETVARSSGLIEQEMNKYLPQITDNKYTRVQVAPDLTMQVFDVGSNQFVNPDMALSQGAREQLYLVARVALHKILSQGRTNFMILDDPFVHFDAKRRRAAMKLLEELAAEMQIILLTHSSDYREFGHVIDLEK